ncbi:MAG: hypothetical protein H6Q90_478 [Deltaproteobacteria bacterium]|nr:hypothetical protein [Deltaproteobacteria bacterium]
MANKRSSKGRSSGRAAERPAKLSVPRTVAPRVDQVAADPTAWFALEISWAKLVTARFLVFGLLALDALRQIPHAPRYGAGDFNVGQLAMFDTLGPGRVAFGACQLLIAYTLVLAACGIATRLVLPIAAVLYAWLYFGSQLDSYQHHYLVALVLLIGCFVPWERPASRGPTVRSWAVRLLLVQLGIMYLWAAISKLDPAWLDGSTLSTQITGSMRSLIESTLGFKLVAIAVVVVELVLAATIWMRRTWSVAAPLGILFHAGILLTGLEIGLFAVLMIALYALVVPDRIWIWGAEHAPLGGLRKLAARTGWGDLGIAIALGLGLAVVTRIPHALVVAVVATTIPLGLALRSHLRGQAPSARLGLVHVGAIALWLVLDRTSSLTVDYYKFWGGSQRRLNHRDTAEQAYRGLIEVAPGEATGHYQLGRLLLPTEHSDEALAELHEAQRLAPTSARAFVEEARWLAGNGKLPEAVEKARQATVAEPSSQDARALLDSLSGSRPAPRSGSADDDVDQ